MAASADDGCLDLDFSGDMELLLDQPTGNGYRRLVVTSGQIDDQAEELFARSHCHWLAGALHSLTGWEIVTFDAQSDTGEWAPIHSAVRAPDGQVVDILGDHASAELLNARYSRERGGRKVRYRVVRSEHMHGDVLRGRDHRGDPLWWIRGTDQATRAVFLHFARLLIQRHRQTTQKPAAQPAQHAGTHLTAVHPSTGGTTAMGIDEIRGVIAQVQQQITDVTGAIQHATQGLDTARAQLAQTLHGSDQHEASESLGALGRALECLDEARQLAQIGGNAAETYSHQL